MHISFEKSSDAEDVYKIIQEFINEPIQYMDIALEECTLYINIEKDELFCIHTYVVPALTKFVTEWKETLYLQEIISNIFYFHDEMEQQNIIQMVYSLVDEVECSTMKEKKREEIVTQSLKKFLSKNISFSFDAFVTFRLKEYLKRLEEYIELAIDEYKLEQDYQDFIESLRKYIFAKTPTFDLIHVVHEKDAFLFYDREYKAITHHIQLIEEDFVTINGFEVDKQVIAPLLFLAPKEIHLYTYFFDHGVVQTLMNIFQERIQCHQYEQFNNIKN
ncbi:putative sporulation protein YtxC [Bacillus salitolerans]|uniref:Sporulation protein YtxC n=1 Tax=Bacillus salitolerans TaxID=1437434 RepID=A0ABW4LN59_9BACI